MHVAWASVTFVIGVLVSTGAAMSVVRSRSFRQPAPSITGQRTVPRRQPAIRPLPAAFANDKTNEARHVA